MLGRAPNVVGQEQNAFDAVVSCACTSRPITGSYPVTIGVLRCLTNTAKLRNQRLYTMPDKI